MATDSTIAAVANKTAVYGGGATFLIGGLTASDFAALAGLAITIISVLVQVVFKRRAERREMAAEARNEQREIEEHAARMAALRREAQQHG